MGTMPVRLTSPTLGLMPTTPFTEAGHTTDPSVSVPSAATASPAATAMPDPELEPQGEREVSCGFRPCPPSALQPDEDLSERKLAHSLKLVLPRTIAPAARRRATSGASRPV
jgi:hypothetical protein